MEINFDYLVKNKLLIYKYVRGSKLYGLDRPESDIDYGGVYIEPLNVLLGTGLGFPEDVHNETNDESWFSLKKYSQLLLRSNPNVLESLFVPDELVVYKHPIMDYILKERDKFVTKKCFNSFIGYAKTQIEKARNLKKKIVCPIEGPLKSCLEFIMYQENGGSKPVVEWLVKHELLQEHCGLVNLDKMPCSYCMYYDWGAHLLDLGIKDWDSFNKYVQEGFSKNNKFVVFLLRYAATNLEIYSVGVDNFCDFLLESELKKIWEIYKTPFKYKGLVNREDTSNQVRLSSIPKGEKPILDISYNKDGYSRYCRQWREYNDFAKHHNEERFNLAKEKQFDRKNVCHANRLLNMGIEIAKGEGFLVDRRGIDKDYLMKIRLGETDYDTIMKNLREKDEEMKKAMETSTIPEEISEEFLNDILIKMRMDFYGLNP